MISVWEVLGKGQSGRERGRGGYEVYVGRTGTRKSKKGMRRLEEGE